MEDGGDPLTKSAAMKKMKRCSKEGCSKYAQRDCNGMCIGHHNEEKTGTNNGRPSAIRGFRNGVPCHDLPVNEPNYVSKLTDICLLERGDRGRRAKLILEDIEGSWAWYEKQHHLIAVEGEEAKAAAAALEKCRASRRQDRDASAKLAREIWLQGMCDIVSYICVSLTCTVELFVCGLRFCMCVSSIIVVIILSVFTHAKQINTAERLRRERGDINHGPPAPIDQLLPEHTADLIKTNPKATGAQIVAHAKSAIVHYSSRGHVRHS